MGQRIYRLTFVGMEDVDGGPLITFYDIILMANGFT